MFNSHLSSFLHVGTWFDWVKTQDFAGVRYIICQQEICPKTGRDHIQGYIHFSTQKRASTVGNLLRCKPETFQTCRGTPSDNRAYCNKTETRKPGTSTYENGDVPGGQGAKLSNVADSIKNRGIVATINTYPETYLSHAPGMHRLANFYQIQELRGKRRTTPVNLFIAWGEAGSGKTYWADNYDPLNTFTLPEQSNSGPTWFDGYEGEATLVIQDFDKNMLNYRTLLRMCDETFHQFKIHGGYCIGKWDTILITANSQPAEWYNHALNPWYYDGEQVGPLQRRVTKLFQGTGRYPDNQWIEDNHPIIVMPTRETIGDCVDVEEQPAEAAGPAPVESDATRASELPSNPVLDSPELTLTDLLDDFAAQDLDFLRDVSPAAPSEDPDGIIDGGDGDVDPLAGHWLDQGFTHF